MIEIKLNAKYSVDRTKIEVTDVTGWDLITRNQYRFLFYTNINGEIFLDRGKDLSWTFDVDPLVALDLKGYIIPVYNPEAIYIDSGTLVAYDGIPDMTLWISGNNPILAPGIDPEWFSLPTGNIFQAFDDGQTLTASPTVIVVTWGKDDYVPVFPELLMKVTPNIGFSEVTVEDITAWADIRDKFALIIAYSSDNFSGEWLYKVAIPNDMQWFIPTPVLQDYSFKAFTIPLWKDYYAYSSWNFVAIPVLDAYQLIAGYRYFQCNYPTQTSPLEDMVNWQEIGPTIDSEGFQGNIGVANNVSVDFHIVFRIMPGVIVTKSGEYNYLITPSKPLCAVPTIKLYTFDQYINNDVPSLETVYGINDPLSVIVPIDNLYVAVITGKDYNLVAVIYCFDVLRNVMKTVLHDILCPTTILGFPFWPIEGVPCEIKKLIHQKRTFATAVTTTVFLLNGMIHSAEVKSYGVFIMTETRLAELQRANDILKKTLLMYAAYNVTPSTNCLPL